MTKELFIFITNQMEELNGHILKYLIITAEEHAPYGGLGSMVSQICAAECPRKVINITLPDEPVITGNSQEVFDYYGMNTQGIANTVISALNSL